MRRALSALAIALAIHGLLAVALDVYLSHTSSPETLAALDISSVKLSFSENEDETAAAVSQSALLEAPPESLKPETEQPRLPESERIPPPAPPAPDRFLVPKEESRWMETQVSKSVRSETTAEPKVQPVPRSVPVSVAAPRQAKVDAPPRPRRSIRPEYPQGARQRGEQGDVLLEILVDAEGDVDDVKILRSSGFAELDAAAVKAVRAARFAPARSGDRAVVSAARLSLVFKLR